MRGLGRWLFRWRARRRLRADLGIWYRPEYAMSALSGTARVPYLDVHRAERIAGALLTRGLVRAAELRRAEPATMQELLRVHHPDWLEAAAEPDMLARVLGLEPSHVPVDDVLRAHRAAVGGTIAAARAVAGHELRIGFNLGGGFHHAEPEQGSGFCVYNDVAVAIESLRAEGFTERIAVVELDYHQGNGTLVAFADDPSVLTWSIHGSVWTHVDAVADRGHVLPAGTGDAEYLELLERQLGKALRSFRPGLVVYVAGMDVLAGDRLGDFDHPQRS